MLYSELQEALCRVQCVHTAVPRNRNLGVTVSFLFQTHSNVVNSHPNGPMVIDLLCGDRLGLVSQKYPQQQQQTLVAINNTYRKRENEDKRVND